MLIAEKPAPECTLLFQFQSRTDHKLELANQQPALAVNKRRQHRLDVTKPKNNQHCYNNVTSERIFN
jgi:hypothetical protein